MFHNVLTIDRLSYVIGEHDLFNSITISFLPSSIVHITGKNGSGKSSLLKIIAGIQKPTSGTFYFGASKNCEYDSFFLEGQNKLPYCLYIGHKLGLKNELTVIENLRFWSNLYNSSETLDASIYYFGLQKILDKKCYELSAGNQKKVALSKLLSCQSELWLLDEVDTNLDEENKQLLHGLIASKASNEGIIMIASHAEIIKNAYTLSLN